MIEAPNIILDNENERPLLLYPDGSARPRIVGRETEFGSQAWPIKNKAAKRTLAENDFYDGYSSAPWQDSLNLLKQKLPFEWRQYLETSGGRIYLDTPKAEYCTPELTRITDVPLYVLNGYMRMAKLLSSAALPIQLTANNNDVSGQSWGSHQNLLARRLLAERQYVPVLVAHAASRICWSGNGAIVRPLRNRTDDFEFHLSERAEMIRDDYNSHTKQQRPLLHSRDEPLGDYELRRIHDISADSVFSPEVIALLAASSSIILRACELGTNFDDLVLLQPVRAVHEFSADTTLKQTCETEDGSRETAISLQRRIAERALAATIAVGYITDEEMQYGQRWLELLDTLEQDPTEASDTVDWVIKKQMVERAISKRKPNEKLTPHDHAFTVGVFFSGLLNSMQKPDSTFIREGTAMKLLRGGHYRNSEAIIPLLDVELPPPPTRAARRVRILRQLIERVQPGMNQMERERLMPNNVSWERIGYEENGVKKMIHLLDPYQTSDW